MFIIVIIAALLFVANLTARMSTFNQNFADAVQAAKAANKEHNV